MLSQTILSGIKVLDLSRLLPAPLATLFMADLGAEVIKIEDPASPDPIRFYPPMIAEQSVYYLALNRSKRSLTLPLRTELGKKAFLDLVATADVVVESYRAGVLQKMGIDYQTAQKINPRIIYVSVTGYGQNSAYSHLAGHDLNYTALAGVIGLNKTPQQQPFIPGVQIADIAGGSYQALNACILALFARERTGLGSHVDVAMVDGTLPLLSIPLAVAQISTLQDALQQAAILTGALPNYNIYKCSDDKYLALGALEPKFWQNFCIAINQPNWTERLFIDNQALHTDLTALFASQPSTHWLQLTATADCCLTAVNQLNDLMNDPYLQSRNLFVTHQYNQQSVTGIKYPIKNSHFDTANSQPAPYLGQDTTTILQNLGYTPQQIKALE